MRLWTRFTPNTKIIDGNPAVWAYFNLPREQLLDRRWIGLLPDSWADRVERILSGVSRRRREVVITHPVAVQVRLVELTWHNRAFFRGGRLTHFEGRCLAPIVEHAEMARLAADEEEELAEDGDSESSASPLPG
jgi:PAS domain-containing protein